MPKPKRQRQHYSSSTRHDRDHSGPSAAPAIPAAAYPRAYEAQLVRSQSNALPQLIPWAGDHEHKILADRYDVVHLLDALPSPRSVSPTSSLSSSWSLEEGYEDEFELSGEEEVAAHSERRRRAWVDGLREARLREREREDDEEEERKAERAREHDKLQNETPPDDILKLMTHTARALASSPNPSQLLMRIVTRQGNDDRFAFLRPDGRYSATWTRIRGTPATSSSASKSSNAPAPAAAQTQQTATLVGDYDSSDTDSDSSAAGCAQRSRHGPSLPSRASAETTPPPPPPPPDDMPPPPPPGSPPPHP